MTFTFDHSDECTVIACSECAWRVNTDRDRSNTTALHHQETAHPADSRMREQVKTRLRREQRR